MIQRLIALNVLHGGNFGTLFLAYYGSYRAEILVECHQHGGHCVGIFGDLNLI
jgi:hypothetical protein